MKSVVWSCTTRCGLQCGFCFGPKNEEELPTGKGRELLQKIKAAGAKTIVFTGGDPLLREDLALLLEDAKRLGFTVILNTNGSLLSKEFVSANKACLDKVNLPLDGPDAATHDAMRGCPGHFDRVLQALDYCREAGLKLMVSTVASRKNAERIPGIASLLGGVEEWRVFQFNPRAGPAAQNASEYSLTDEGFNALKQRIDFPATRFIPKQSVFDSSYVLVSPQGNVFQPSGEKEEPKGSVFELSAEELEDLLRT